MLFSKRKASLWNGQVGYWISRQGVVLERHAQEGDRGALL
jgi:hypothetical protein